MADIFQEVEEDLRRERAKKVWDKYGTLIIAVAVLIVAAVAGWRGYEWYQTKQADEAGARFEGALMLAREGKSSEAEAALSGLIAEAPGGYQALARFRLAAEIGKRDPAEGAKAFAALASDASVGALLRDLATVRGAMLEVDTKPYAEFKPMLEPLAAPTSAWRHSARELLGLSAYKAKDLVEASKWFLEASSDPQAPSSVRQRADLMMQLIAADTPAASGS